MTLVSTCVQILMDVRVCFEELWPNACLTSFFLGQLLAGLTIWKPWHPTRKFLKNHSKSTLVKFAMVDHISLNLSKLN